MDDQLRVMSDKLACAELVYRLARGLDRCDAQLLHSVFHDDATDDHGSFVGPARDFVPWALGLLATMLRTQHCISNILVEVTGDRAQGESYFVAYHHIAGPEGMSLLTVAGRYLDSFERREGVWKIAHRCCVGDWTHTEAAAEVWDRDAPGARTFGQRGRQDRSYLDG